jgi:nucleotide-binding universal stress UspA family protein
MKTIIVPTDFSENAQKALELAVDIARRANGRLVIFNAYDLPYSQNVMTTSLLDIMKNNSEEGLADIAENLKETGVPFTTESRLGNPIRSVKEVVKKEDGDLVVLGTKGASGIEEVLIGSNAASILHAVDCPVLAVPAKGELGEVKRIVYACDLNEKGETGALSQLRTLAQLYEAEIMVLHVQDPDGPELKVINKPYYEKAFEGCAVSFHIVDQNESLEKTILKFAEVNKIGLLSMMARRYGFLQGLFHKSMTSQVAFNTRLPFLTLHEY